VSRKLASQRYEQLRDIATDLIEGYGFSYPLQPLQIADTWGVRVSVHRQWSAGLALACGTVDGFTVPVHSRHGMKFEVHLNAAMPPVRQRFTAVHELSHVALEHPIFPVRLSKDVAEAEANHLASYLLAPDVLVCSWVPTLSVVGIAREFGLSDEAARLTHARVLRTLHRGSGDEARDQRILAAATRSEVLGGWVEPLPLWGSA
jgi:hypothetical protein